MSAKNDAPIIIKKVKKGGGDGHHGGAWKVAYADFVTAMMAFFLLMWLLNATTESQRKGIADYFNPSIPLSRVSGGGDGSFGGDSVFSEETLAQNGAGGSRKKPSDQKAAKGDIGTQKDKEKATETLSDIEAELLGKTGESMLRDLTRRHVLTRQTDEGLVIELFDIEGEPLFIDGTDTPSQIMIDLLEMLAPILGTVANQVAIGAHIRGHPVVALDPMVWEITSQRARSVRIELTKSGLDDTRFDRMSGHGDRKPVAANHLAIRNNRIEIILLRSDI